MDIRKVEHREFLHIIVIFLAAQFAGLFLATQLFSGQTFQEIQGAQSASALSGSIDYALYVIALIIGFSLIMILITKLYKGAKLLYVIESVVIFGAAFFAFATLLSSLFNYIGLQNNAATQGDLLISAVVLSIAVIAIKNIVPRTRNYVTILISAGVGLIWGYNFGFITTYILFAILAVYDVIAVFITKHMVTMANAMIGKNLTFMVQVGDVQALPERDVMQKNAKYVRDMDRMAKSDSFTKDIRKQKMVPVPVGNALGTGDIVIPMALAISAYTVNLNFVLSLFIIFGALLGFVMLFFILNRMKRMLPALPPLLFGCTIGMAAYFLLYIVL